MNSKFNPYEIIGVVAPGGVLLFGVMLLFPSLKPIATGQGFSLGDLGVFVILAYVAGHMIQALGNLLESTFWLPFGGMPTAWVNCEKPRLLDASQHERLRKILETKYPRSGPSYSYWAGIVREIYSEMQRAGRVERVDAFNRTYGLLRGVSAAFLTLAPLVLLWASAEWRIALLLLAAAVICAYRMHRFGRWYARELFVEYLLANRPDAVPPAKPATSS